MCFLWIILKVKTLTKIALCILLKDLNYTFQNKYLIYPELSVAYGVLWRFNFLFFPVWIIFFLQQVSKSLSFTQWSSKASFLIYQVSFYINIYIYIKYTYIYMSILRDSVLFIGLCVDPYTSITMFNYCSTIKSKVVQESPCNFLP